jgi:hypothetical protein
MTKTFFSLVLMLTASMSFAQSITAGAVCQKITQANAANSAICAQLIARNIFDQGALNVAYRTVDVGSSYAIEVLKVTANKRVDLNASMVCEKIISINSANVAPCMTTIADAYVAPELVQIASAVLQGGSSYALAVLKIGVNAYFFAPAANICTAMTTVNAANVPVCTQIIANKIVMNGAEQVCRTALNSGSTYAIDCLRNVVSDYVNPGQFSTTVGVEIQKLQDLRRDLMKTRNLLDRNMIEHARRSLDVSVRAVEDILAGPVI